MSLLKQLFLMILCLFLLFFGGTFLISVHSVYQFSQEQLRSNAQDTAASLGLSLSDPLKSGDHILVERMIDSIFDRGFYWRITLEDIQENVIYEKISSLKYGDAPNWLMHFFEIIPPEEQSLLKTGWKNSGVIKVVSHPRYLNLQLWEVFKETFWWFSGVSLLSLLLAAMILKLLLRSLSRVVCQAQAICHRRFPTQATLPWTTDFKIVVRAMNKLSQILKRIFQEHTNLAEVLKEKVYQDPNTGLGNRRYFIEQFDFLVRSDLEKQAGALFLIRLFQFSEYKQHWGYEAADQLLKKVANYLRTLGLSKQFSIFGSLDGGDFALSIPEVEKSALKQMARKMIQEVAQFDTHRSSLQKIKFHIGIGSFSHGDDPNVVFKNAELALRASEVSRENDFHLIGRFDAKRTLNSEQWQHIFETILQQQKMNLYAQPIVRFKAGRTTVYQSEILMRCIDQNQELVSSTHMFMQAKKTGVLPTLDRIMIQQVLSLLRSDPTTNRAINISILTLESENFFDWIQETFEKNRSHLHLLSIEFPERLVQKHLKKLIDFANLVHPYGVGIALDHFGRGFSSLGYLDQFSIDYIKIHGSYIRGIEHRLENQFIVRSFVEIAHGLDLQVVALGVETDLELATLQTLNVDLYQGFLIGKPVPLNV